MPTVAPFRPRDITAEILEAIGHTPGCQLDELAVSFPSVTWKQIVVEVARLSRNGQVHITVAAENCIVRLQIPVNTH